MDIVLVSTSVTGTIGLIVLLNTLIKSKFIRTKEWNNIKEKVQKVEEILRDLKASGEVQDRDIEKVEADIKDLIKYIIEKRYTQ